MRQISIIPVLLFLFFLTQGQTPVGSWSDHLLYNSAKNVAVGEKEIFASTGSSIIVYNKDLAELKKMSRTNGLTETGISTIAWSEEYSTLIIAYSSTNVDLVKNSTIYNIPDISRKNISGKKEINRIRINGKYAYLACSFGLIVMDINKKEIFDTWNPGEEGLSDVEVWDVAFGNGKVYAATGNGVFSADLSNQGLSYYGNWSLINILPNPYGKYSSVLYSGDKLYVNLSVTSTGGDSVYAIDTGCTLFSRTSGVYNTSIDKGSTGFTVSSSNSVKYYNDDGTLVNKISSYNNPDLKPKIAQAIVDNEDIWIADLNSGLIRGEQMADFTALTLPGPISNTAFSITSYNGKTIICDGALTSSWTQTFRPLKVSIHENNQWSSVSSAKIRDAMRAVIDPENSDHIFVSTWGGGLLEYRNNILEQQYTEANSPLQTIIAGQAYVRICGLAFDKNKNLWMTQSEVPGSLKVLKPDGTWIVNPITIDALRVGDLIITKAGHKWMILPIGEGLFIFDDNDTPENFNDDRSKKLLVKDSENKVISNVYSIAEDLDGNIWIGTDQGPLIYYNPERVFDDDLKAYRINIPRNDGTGLGDYLLTTETITSIAIDGANRKWLGTISSGAYHLSSEGTTLIKNYNEQNSPLLSNYVVSLAIDNKSGNIWFGTLKGIQSVRGEATTGEEKFTNVHTFPNPVKGDFTGNVTITGLMRDSQIRITDISGNLVYKTVSDGGQATWDLKIYNGRRVSTGVYLIFCSSSDGSQTFVSKMLVIR